MKATVYVSGGKYGFFIHNDSILNLRIAFDSGAIYDSYMMAWNAAQAHV